MKATFSETNIISPWNNQWSEDESFPFGAVTVPFRECNQVWLLLSLRDWNTTCVHFANGCKAELTSCKSERMNDPFAARVYRSHLYFFSTGRTPPNLADPKLIYVQQHLFMSKPMYQYKFICIYIYSYYCSLEWCLLILSRTVGKMYSPSTTKNGHCS